MDINIVLVGSPSCSEEAHTDRSGTESKGSWAPESQHNTEFSFQDNTRFPPLYYSHLLWGDFKCRRPHVDLFIGVHTGDDEEDPGTPGSTGDQPSQPEDDGSLVLLDNIIIMTHHRTITPQASYNTTASTGLCWCNFLFYFQFIVSVPTSPRVPVTLCNNSVDFSYQALYQEIECIEPGTVLAQVINWSQSEKKIHHFKGGRRRKEGGSPSS